MEFCRGPYQSRLNGQWQRKCENMAIWGTHAIENTGQYNLFFKKCYISTSDHVIFNTHVGVMETATPKPAALICEVDHVQNWHNTEDIVHSYDRAQPQPKCYSSAQCTSAVAYSMHAHMP